MAWWQFEPEKKPPFVPPDSSGEGDFRFPFVMLCLAVGIVATLATIVSLFVKGWAFAPWSIGIAVAAFIAAAVLLPRDRSIR